MSVLSYFTAKHKSEQWIVLNSTVWSRKCARSALRKNTFTTPLHLINQIMNTSVLSGCSLRYPRWTLQLKLSPSHLNVILKMVLTMITLKHCIICRYRYRYRSKLNLSNAAKRQTIVQSKSSKPLASSFTFSRILLHSSTQPIKACGTC